MVSSLLYTQYWSRLLVKTVCFVLILILIFGPLQEAFDPSFVYAQQTPGSDSTATEASIPGTATACNSVGSCIASVVYVFTAGLGSGLAYMSSWFFSIAVKASLLSTTYQLDLLSDGWTTVRDLANMAFIFILIYLAFTIMLKAETTNTLQTLARVILIALILNFSFFLTRVVVDTGNILAIQFYNTLPNGTLIVQTPAGASTEIATVGGETKDLSASIMNGLDIQNLLGTEAFGRFKNDTNWFTELIVLSFIYLAVGVILFLLAAIFFAVGIKFMVRIVVLWLAIIAAPLALVLYTMRKSKPYFEMWLHALLAYSIYPAVFLFIFLIITHFAESLGNITELFVDINQARNFNNLEYFGAVAANIAIRLGFIILLLYFALKVSDAVSRWGSETAFNIAGSIQRGAVGFGFRRMAAVTSFAGRNTLGRAGYNLLQNPRLQNIARQSGGRDLLWRGAGKLATSTYNVRHLPGGGTLNDPVMKDLYGGKINTGKGSDKVYQPAPAAPAAAAPLPLSTTLPSRTPLPSPSTVPQIPSSSQQAIPPPPQRLAPPTPTLAANNTNVQRIAQRLSNNNAVVASLQNPKNSSRTAPKPVDLTQESMQKINKNTKKQVTLAAEHLAERLAHRTKEEATKTSENVKRSSETVSKTIETNIKEVATLTQEKDGVYRPNQNMHAVPPSSKGPTLDLKPTWTRNASDASNVYRGPWPGSSTNTTSTPPPPPSPPPPSAEGSSKDEDTDSKSAAS